MGPASPGAPRVPCIPLSPLIDVALPPLRLLSNMRGNAFSLQLLKLARPDVDDELPSKKPCSHT